MINDYFFGLCFSVYAFSALTLLVGWQEGHLPVKNEWWDWGTGMVITLEQGADLHIAQLMMLPLTVSCFITVLCVCVCVWALFLYTFGCPKIFLWE